MNCRFSLMTRIRPESLLPNSLLLIIGLWGGSTSTNGQATLEGLTFNDALEACIQAVSAGNLELASDLFQNLESSFGEEELYQSKEAQSRLLPLEGLAELGAGRNQEAAKTLEKLREMFPEVILKNASLLYGLAEAYRGTEEFGKARDILSLYIIQFPGTPDTGLAFLERIDLFFQEELTDEGLAAVDQFLESNAPESLKMQARLKGIQACLNESRMEEALRRMLDGPWSITTMPELAQLAFSALRCGENAMVQGKYNEALRLFQLVPPKQQLVELQQQKLDELTTRILSGRRRALLSSDRHLQAYLNNLRMELTSRLKALVDSEDYTPGFYLQYGQCLLLDDQLYKAWLVFEYLALKEAYPERIREEAHYRWVVCAHQLEDWEEALTIARNFVARYPESKLAPQALYLIAKSHLEQRRYPESNEVLNDLISHFPEHPLLGRWLFTRGFNKVVLEDYEGARADFGEYSKAFPKGALIVNARLWNALTHFFEKDYAACVDQLTELLTIDARQPLYPEILYRLASAYYSERNYDKALESIESFLTAFQRHRRVDEARVLKGDILMGMGALEEAKETFKTVSLESQDLYLYGLFQVGKILRAEEDYSAMAHHFAGFIDDGAAPRIRVSEALYWLGWAYQQQDQIELAFPVFEKALQTYGDDANAAETQSILQALEKLKKRQVASHTESNSRLVRAPDFMSWIEAEIASASENKKPTYLSRLTLYINERYPKIGAERFPLLQLADVAPMEKLDPDALGKVGLVLLEQNDARAKEYFSYLIDTYPHSNARAMAYLGLARITKKAGDFEKAKKWLTKSADQVPVHPLMNDTQLLLGNVLAELHDYDGAVDVFEKLLRLKSARGRPHALALKGIAQVYEAQGNTEKASAYHQRIYNMYRAYPDLVAEAYWKSARLFESMNRIPEAVNTLQEMLKQPQLSKYPEWRSAEELLPRLRLEMPEESEPLKERGELDEHE